MATKDQYLITASVDGVQIPEPFDTFKGGKADSAELKYRGGGAGADRARGGNQMTDNVTVGRLYERARDHGLVRSLRPRRGRARMAVSRQPLDEDLHPFGEPDVYTGILKAVLPTDVDSESSAADIFELEMSTDSDVG